MPVFRKEVFTKQLTFILCSAKIKEENPDDPGIELKSKPAGREDR